MKKMRRLIPAIAMLLVSAVMLSTASFAWFTMNDQVKVNGMQVQAKASGNLLISTGLMDATASGITVDFAGNGKEELKPITYIPAKTEGDTTTAARWETVGTNTVVDPLYGTATGEMLVISNLAITATEEYFYEETVYLATAGEEYDAPLIVNIEALSGASEKIANAYTIALLVGDNTDWNNPDLVYSYHDKVVDSKTDMSAGTVTIPSTYGKTADNAVGLKVVIRIYVDGALKTTDSTVQVKVLKAMDYSTSEKYNPTTMADYTFYSSNDERAIVDKTDFDADTNLKELGITHYNDGETKSETHATNYVNNASVPAVGTVFAISFKATEPTT